MRRITVATISVAASLALAACAERDTTSPRSINPGQASFAGGPNSTACSFNNTSKAAKDYFTSNQDPVYTVLSTWSTAYNKDGAAASTHYGWDVLRIVASERLTTATHDGVPGAAFVVMTVRCMTDLSANANGAQLQLPPALIANGNLLLARVLNSGIFEIRDGNAAAGPAIGQDMSGGTKARSAPGWGVEASNGVWPGTITYAVIGYPTIDTNPILKDPPLIGTNDDLGANATSLYQANGTWPFNAFELTPLPANALSQQDHLNLLVAICVHSNTTVGDGIVSFLVHNDNELVPNSKPSAQLCPDPTASLSTALPWYRRLARGTAAFFKPGILYAQEDSRDFIGGLPSGWSPMGGGNIDPTMVTLTITRQPVNNTRDSMPDSLVVLATVKGTNTPVPHLRINGLTVLNNQGSPAGAVIDSGSTNLPIYTDGITGKATVYFAIGKPGAYYIVVSSSLDAVAATSATTVKFNVKN